ncbi:hypothetical protein F5890DRAFT_1611509 [Lentinula detonsa]|uniref:Uncharacterized protein n=1 Tax=Lentinula detonsa TaxID=2804962 RepID=A0AA38PUB1_9AGAR|nr:hypothetical protein F5890DRAFT_1611509 [Lentinula detonsa]
MILPIHRFIFLFFLSTTFVSQHNAFALPVGNYSTPISVREAVGPTPDELIAGYRYVSKTKADEYNEAGTLTVIPATTKSIGEGAYLSPRLGEFPGKLDETYWECVIFAQKSKILSQLNPKFFVDDKAAISAQPTKLFLYAHKHGFEIGKTVLFSRHFVFKNTLQMLIPPIFLVKSPSNPSRPAGTNSLGLRIHCVPLGGLGKNRPAADWQNWSIHNWPAAVKTREEPV